eukprot:5286756-Prymnesium_polylepis.1
MSGCRRAGGVAGPIRCCRNARAAATRARRPAGARLAQERLGAADCTGNPCRSTARAAPRGAA